MDWIAVDWGTSTLRAFGMSADGRLLWEAQSDDGMGQMSPDGFEPAFLKLVAPYIGETEKNIDVIACGMVGARQGWIEAGYRKVPCRPLDPDLTSAPTRTPHLRFRIVSGLSQSKPADVMRGEETQIAGFQALNPDFDGVLCMPGTHTKWVHVSAGEIVSFQTCMTGDLFAAISGHTVLRHSVDTDDWNAGAFTDAVGDAISHPERLAARLFALRAEGLLHGLSAGSARARLSGLLIGAELAATRPYWLGQAVAIIGAGQVTRLYAMALDEQGIAPTIADGDSMVLKGLQTARALSSGSIE